MKKDKALSKDKEKNIGKSRNTTGLAGISLLFYLMDKLSDVVYNALINGFFGYIFTAYNSELSAYQNGYVISYFKGGEMHRVV